MNKVTITIDTNDLMRGDEIVQQVMSGKWQVRRIMPTRCHDINATLQYALDSREEIAADGLIAIDEHMRAGGVLPDVWCSGVDEKGPWLRQSNVMRPDPHSEGSTIRVIQVMHPFKPPADGQDKCDQGVCGLKRAQHLSATHVIPGPDMPGEDDLDAALLEAARRYQVPHLFELNTDDPRGRCICGQAEHSSAHIWA